MNRRISDLVRRFNVSDINTEFEVRFYHKFKKKTEGVELKRIMGTGIIEITNTVDILVGHKRKRIVRYPNKPNMSIHIEKKNIGYVISDTKQGHCKYALSSENGIARFKTDGAKKIIRVKTTVTAFHKDWRLDVSFVKRTMDLANIKIEIEKLHRFNSTDILTSVSYQYLVDCSDTVEIELEYTGLGALELKNLNTEVDRMFNLLNPIDNKVGSMANQYQDVLNGVAAQLQPKATRISFKSILPKAKEIPYHKYTDVDLESLVVRHKIDGVRNLLWCTGSIVYMIDAADCTRVKLNSRVGEYILDTECVDDTWYVLHIMYIKGVEYSGLPDLSDISDFVDAMEVKGKYVKLCPYVVAPTLNELKDFYMATTPYETDGLIISYPKLGKVSDYYDDVYVKWKENPTVDFLMRKAPYSLIAMLKKNNRLASFNDDDNMVMYIAHVGINHNSPHMSKYNHRINGAKNMHQVTSNRKHKLWTQKQSIGYRPMVFSPVEYPDMGIWYSDNTNLDGKVIEFDISGGNLKMLKIRQDRKSICNGGDSCGNNYHVAQDTLSRIITGDFTIDKILEPFTPILNEVPDKMDKVYHDTLRHVLPYLDGKLDLITVHNIDGYIEDVKRHVTYVDCKGETEILNMGSVNIVALDKMRRGNPFFRNQYKQAEVVVSMAKLTSISKTDKWYKLMDTLTTNDAFICYIGSLDGIKRIIKSNPSVVCQIELTPLLNLIVIQKGEHTHEMADHCSVDKPLFKYFRTKKQLMFPGHKNKYDKTTIVNMIDDKPTGIYLTVVEIIGKIIIARKKGKIPSPGKLNVHYIGNREVLQKINELFPDLIFTSTDVELIVNMEEYNLSVIDEYDPIYSICMFDCDKKEVKVVYGGQWYFIPYCNDTSVILYANRKFKKTYVKENIIGEIHHKEMDYFRYVYKSTRFSYHMSSEYKNTEHDYCYDCRTKHLIMTKLKPFL